MGRLGGLVFRGLDIITYGLIFGSSCVILGIFSYFLAVLADRKLPIANRWKAVEGISGAAIVFSFLWTITCCCQGFALVYIVFMTLDILFLAGFIYIAIVTRHGASSCKGIVNTPLGIGPADKKAAGYGANGFGFGKGENATYAPDLHLACRLNTAVFAVAIIGAFLFLFAILYEYKIRRDRKEDLYAARTERRSPRFAFFRRNRGTDIPLANNDNQQMPYDYEKSREPQMARDSNEPTGTFGTTGNGSGYAPAVTQPGAASGTHTNYLNQAEGTGTNPYK